MEWWYACLVGGLFGVSRLGGHTPLAALAPPFAARKGKGHPSAQARLGFGFRRNDGGVRVVDLPPAPS